MAELCPQEAECDNLQKFHHLCSLKGSPWPETSTELFLMVDCTHHLLPLITPQVIYERFIATISLRCHYSSTTVKNHCQRAICDCTILYHTYFDQQNHTRLRFLLQIQTGGQTVSSDFLEVFCMEISLRLIF